MKQLKLKKALTSRQLQAISNMIVKIRKMERRDKLVNELIL